MEDRPSAPGMLLESSNSITSLHLLLYSFPGFAQGVELLNFIAFYYLQRRDETATIVAIGRTKERSSTMKRDDLTADERIIYMPTWERVALGAFCALLPIVGSIVAISL